MSQAKVLWEPGGNRDLVTAVRASVLGDLAAGRAEALMPVHLIDGDACTHPE
jgi:hypothetical protein